MTDVVFFFNDTATTEIYTLSLHDALPISKVLDAVLAVIDRKFMGPDVDTAALAERHRDRVLDARSEEHTSELQSRQYLVCRLLLEKKKKRNNGLLFHF